MPEPLCLNPFGCESQKTAPGAMRGALPNAPYIHIFSKAQANMATCICDLTVSTSLIAHPRHWIRSTDHQGRFDPAPARDLLVFTNVFVWFEELKEVELG
jgi:hypothetical protein